MTGKRQDVLMQVSEGWLPGDHAVGAVSYASPHPPVPFQPLLQQSAARWVRLTDDRTVQQDRVLLDPIWLV